MPRTTTVLHSERERLYICTSAVCGQARSS